MGFSFGWVFLFRLMPDPALYLPGEIRRYGLDEKACVLFQFLFPMILFVGNKGDARPATEGLLTEKLLRAVLVGDGFLGRIVGPEIGLDARTALITGVTGAVTGFRAVIGHARAAGNQRKNNEEKQPAHGL